MATILLSGGREIRVKDEPLEIQRRVAEVRELARRGDDVFCEFTTVHTDESVWIRYSAVEGIRR
jgi:hypothetical protein